MFIDKRISSKKKSLRKKSLEGTKKVDAPPTGPRKSGESKRKLGEISKKRRDRQQLTLKKHKKQKLNQKKTEMKASAKK